MSLSEHMEKLLSDPHHADVVLVACPKDGESEEFPVCSHMLRRCPYFERMLAPSAPEDVERRRLELKAASPRLLKQLIRYLYTDRLELSGAGEEGESTGWHVKDLVELLAFLHVYEAPKTALDIAAGHLARVIEDGGVDIALEVMAIAALDTGVARLLAAGKEVSRGLLQALRRGGLEAALRAVQQGLQTGLAEELLQQLGDLLVQITERGGYQAAFKAARECLRFSEVPQQVVPITEILAKRVVFGTGQLVEVLAWSVKEAAAAQGHGSLGLDWDAFQAKSLNCVCRDTDLLESELGRRADPSASSARLALTDAALCEPHGVGAAGTAGPGSGGGAAQLAVARGMVLQRFLKCAAGRAAAAVDVACPHCEGKLVHFWDAAPESGISLLFRDLRALAEENAALAARLEEAQRPRPRRRRSVETTLEERLASEASAAVVGEGPVGAAASHSGSAVAGAEPQRSGKRRACGALVCCNRGG